MNHTKSVVLVLLIAFNIFFEHALCLAKPTSFGDLNHWLDAWKKFEFWKPYPSNPSLPPTMASNFDEEDFGGIPFPNLLAWALNQWSGSESDASQSNDSSFPIVDEMHLHGMPSYCCCWFLFLEAFFRHHFLKPVHCVGVQLFWQTVLLALWGLPPWNGARIHGLPAFHGGWQWGKEIQLHSWSGSR